MEIYDVVIIGGGASGVSCALNVKKDNPQLKVLILEQNDKVLKKVLKTGNGKCNIANEDISEEYYHNYSFFSQWVNDFDVREYFKKLGLLIKSDEVGRLYPHSETSNSVVNILLHQLEKENVEVRTNFCVKKITKNRYFVIEGKEIVRSRFLVLATGSIAQEKTNSYELAEGFLHHITELKPGLVPLKVEENVKSLSGIRVKCIAQYKDIMKSGEILFKDEGISGILALELSRYVKKGDNVYFDLATDYSKEELTEFLKTNDLEVAVEGIVPKMLGKYLLKISNDPIELCNNLKRFTLKIKDSYDYSMAQIVCGGVKLEEMNNDFSSKLVPRLYIIGEVLDVDGDCGGYNLYFAWLSAYVCSLSIKNYLLM